MGDQWGIWQLNEYGADHGVGFVPTTDDQWVTLQATFPAWNMATSAELKLRVVRPSYPSFFTPEALYLDDLYVGELPVVTALPDDPARANFLLAPNPARDAFTVHVPRSSMLSIHNAQGQLVHEQRITSGITVIDVPLTAGVYLVRVHGIDRVQRLVVE